MLQGDVLPWGSDKYGICFTMFNAWIAADLRSGRRGGHIRNPKPEEQIYEKLKKFENEVDEATKYFKEKH